MHYLWRAVDHEGEALDVFATKRRDRKAALAFLKRAMKRYGRPQAIVTDRLRSCAAAMKDIGVERPPSARSLAPQSTITSTSTVTSVEDPYSRQPLRGAGRVAQTSGLNNRCPGLSETGLD
jgi:transposase-like protein